MAGYNPTFAPPQAAQDKDLILSAFGKKVKRGELDSSRSPEVKWEEITFLEKIGGGCFGQVFRGRCRGYDVAIKRLLKQELDEKTLEDFRKEVDIMTQMRHPNVLLFMGACFDNGKLAIVCELMQDNLHDLVRKHKEISLSQRLKFAKDTAAGMAWLHGASPQIVHRDLKPQNLLVDAQGNVKVCDFGLSQVKLPNVKIKDGKSIPGTPLWMAPEVLMGKEVDEKADVYAYGIVLWEIITGEELFPHMDSYGTFKQAITVNNERPPMPPTLHAHLRGLMEACWHKDPQMRPSMTQILPILDQLIIEVSVDDDLGQKYWKQYYLGKTHVPWSDFAQTFSSLLGLSPPPANAAALERDLNWACAKKLLTVPSPSPTSDEEVVTIEKFGHVLNWFGPLSLSTKAFSILDKIRVLMQNEWFHGDIEKQTAEDLLASQGKGTFLVRTSTTQPQSPFTISKMTKKGKINHQRVYKTPDGRFSCHIVYNNGKTKEEVSKDDHLVPFVKQLSSELGLEKPCPGSRYKALFVKPAVEGYIADDN